MKKSELEEAVAELMDALRLAVATLNRDRLGRRPRGEIYSAPVLGRFDLVAVERRVAKRKTGGAP